MWDGGLASQALRSVDELAAVLSTAFVTRLLMLLLAVAAIAFLVTVWIGSHR
ncbi:MAG TPA: hypothetical protein VLV86_25860 [Vicinamibacterales bacterium]|nr:hypothetical protein [Vicinamibacterales bacterium]